MKIHAIRLTKGMDFKEKILNFTRNNNIKAGCILTCVGHLTRAILRMADATIVKEFKEEFEITCLSGTLCKDNVHLHINISNRDGNSFGGHVKNNCIIGVTTEIIIIIAELSNLEFSRKFDKDTGYNELDISILNKD